MKKKLNVGDNIKLKSQKFSFSSSTARNFEKHISKSLPVYESSHQIITLLSSFFLKNNSTFYDLGCSTGNLIKKVNNFNNNNTIKYIGYDIEKEMIKIAKKNNPSKNTQFYQKDISKLKLKRCELIVSNFTIMFLEPKIRQDLFDKIYESLHWGGGFIFFEKVRAPDARFQDLMSQIYNEIKLERGYTKENIYDKTVSLRGFLDPYTSKANLDFLKRAGFKDYMTVLKYISFEGFLAIK